MSVQFGVQHQILLLLNDEEDLLTTTYSKHTFGLIYKSAHKVQTWCNMQQNHVLRKKGKNYVFQV